MRWLKVIAMILIGLVLLPWQLAADLIDQRLAWCQPHPKYGTNVWHHHGWLGHRWFTTHS